MAILSESDLKQLVINLRYLETSWRKKRALVYSACTRFTLTSAQAVQILGCLPSSEKLDVLEFMIMKLVDLEQPINQQSLTDIFKGDHKEYVRGMLALCTQRRTGTVQQPLTFTPNPLTVWSVSELEAFMHWFESQLKRPEFWQNTNPSIICKTGVGITQDQCVTLLSWFFNSLFRGNSSESKQLFRQRQYKAFCYLLRVIAPVVWFIQTHSVLDMLELIRTHDPALLEPFLLFLRGRLSDPERVPFVLHKLSKGFGQASATEFQQMVDLSPLLPCPPIFGNLVESKKKRVVFLLDTSSFAAAVAKTLNEERITVLRIGVRALVRLLKDHILAAKNDANAVVTHHDTELVLRDNDQSFERKSGDTSFHTMRSSFLWEDTSQSKVEADELMEVFTHSYNKEIYFNVLTFNDTVQEWSGKLETVNFSNVSHASLFLRQVQPSGGSDLDGALRYVFNKIKTKAWKVDLICPILFRLPSRTSSIASSTSPSSSSKKDDRTEHTVTQTTLSDVERALQEMDSAGQMETFSISPVFIASSHSTSSGLHEASDFLKRLASLGTKPGCARLVSSCKRFSKPQDIERSRAEDLLFDIPANRILLFQALAFFAYLQMIVFAPLISQGFFSGQSCRITSTLYPRYIDLGPRGFLIWRLVFFAMGCVVLFLCSQRKLQKGRRGFTRRQRVILFVVPMFVLFTVATTVGVYCFVNRFLVGATFMSVLQIVTMSALHRVLVAQQRIGTLYGSRKFNLTISTPSFWEPLLLQLPISMALAISIFSFVQLLYIVVIGDAGVGASFEVPISILAVATLFIIALGLLWSHRDTGFALTTIWLLLSISLNSASVSKDIRQADLQSGWGMFTGEFIAQVFIALFVGVLGVMCLSMIYLDTVRFLFERLGISTEGIHDSNRGKILKLQSLNLSFFVVVSVFLWGRLSVNYESSCSAPLNEFLSQSQTPALLMLPRWSFKAAWAVLLVWKAIFVLLQSIPTEVVYLSTSQMEEVRDSDLSIGHMSFFRFHESIGLYTGTWRFHHLILHKIGYSFLIECCLEAVFLVSFNNKVLSLSIAVVVLILIVILLVYFHVHGVSSLNTCCSCCCPRRHIRLARTLSRRSFVSRTGVVKTGVLWCLGILPVSEDEQAVERRDSSNAHRLTPLSNPDKLGTWTEVLLFRWPAGFFFGWILYLLFLSVNVLVVVDYPSSLLPTTFLSLNHEFWVCIALFIQLLVLAVLGYWSNNQGFLFGLVWSLAGVMVNSWVEVCSPTTLAGIWIRNRPSELGGGLLLQWTATEETCSTLEGFSFSDSHCRKVLPNCSTTDLESLPGFLSCVEEPLVCPLHAARPQNTLTLQYITGLIAAGGFSACILVVVFLSYLSPSRRKVWSFERVSARRNKKMMRFPTSNQQSS